MAGSYLHHCRLELVAFIAILFKTKISNIIFKNALIINIKQTDTNINGATGKDTAFCLEFMLLCALIATIVSNPMPSAQIPTNAPTRAKSFTSPPHQTPWLKSMAPIKNMTIIHNQLPVRKQPNMIAGSITIFGIQRHNKSVMANTTISVIKIVIFFLKLSLTPCLLEAI